MRAYNDEYKDTDSRPYAYDFDWIIRRYLLKAVASWFDPAGDTLELGCYKGDMTEQILDYFPRITVVEAASDLCQAVAGRFQDKVTVVNATFEEVALTQQYSNIFLVHTLEHLDDPVGALARIGDWLTPGGRLFVAVPNANALSRQIAVRMGLIDYNAAVTPGEYSHGHRRTYTMDLFEHHLRASGLRPVQGGGVLVKPLANFQFDRALKAGIVDEAYLDGCYELGKMYPDLCASLYWVCEKAD